MIKRTKIKIENVKVELLDKDGNIIEQVPIELINRRVKPEV
jgi:hypothetical protein